MNPAEYIKSIKELYKSLPPGLPTDVENKLLDILHRAYADSAFALGYKCINHKDGLCIGGFTQEETKCNGSECCECWCIDLS